MMEGLSWSHSVNDIGAKSRQNRTADVAECETVSQLLGDNICEALRAVYVIKTLSSGRYRVTGELSALIKQTCGVTLDPVHQHIEEAFDVEFRSDFRPTTSSEIDVDAFSEDDPEPIESGEIRVGRFFCELVVSALDPFPRAPDAALDQSESGGADAAHNPFAALAHLKGEG